MPSTLRLRADHAPDIERAAEILRRGGLVAFPTETVYGLGANAFSPPAVDGIFAAKQRPSWDPLIVHLRTFDQVRQVTRINDGQQARIQLLAAAFWPGPLTLLLRRTSEIPDQVTAGRPQVGVRVPAHPVAQALLEAAGVPLAAPSANRFGHISPTTAQHVLDDLDGRIDAVVDGGPTSVGLESTVLDPGETPMLVYRAGAVTLEMLERATGAQAALFTSSRATASVSQLPQSLPSPGVGIRHYAPNVQVILSGTTVDSLQQEIGRMRREQGSIGVLLPSDWHLRSVEELEIQRWGAWDNPDSLAAELFAGLRALERRGVSIIVCPLPRPGGLREALRDRLLKAARPA